MEFFVNGTAINTTAHKRIVYDHLKGENRNKLAAIVETGSNRRYRYSYRVVGRTQDTDFHYENQEYSNRHFVRIVGLYAKAITIVELTVYFEDGEILTIELEFDTTADTYRYPEIYGHLLPSLDIPLHLDYEITDQQMFEDTFGTGWMFAGLGTAYDKNGDLRMAGLYPIKLNPLKLSNDGFMYSGEDIATDNDDAPRRFYKLDLTGEILVEYQIPAGHVVHHDWHADGKGHVYALGSRDPKTLWNDKKDMSIIYKFDDTTGELLWERDYTEEFKGQYILENSDTNDIHFNTMEYVANHDFLITNSRSCSCILGLDPENGDVLWVIDNPSPVTLMPELQLQPTDPDNFVWGNGEHTTLETTNPAFAEWNEQPGRMAMTVFDNNSCKDEDGNFVERVMEWTDSGIFPRVPMGTRTLFYGLDFEARTVELLNVIEFEDFDSQFMGSVYEIGQYYLTTATMAYSLALHDAGQNIGMTCTGNFVSYRSRIFSYAEIRGMLL